jgi:hypothetical protein
MIVTFHMTHIGKHQPSPTVVFLWRQPGFCSTKVPPILGLHAVARPNVHSSATNSWQLETRFVKGKVALSLLGARNWLIGDYELPHRNMYEASNVMGWDRSIFHAGVSKCPKLSHHPTSVDVISNKYI